MDYSRKELLQLPNHHLSFDEFITFDEETLKQFPRIRRLSEVRATGEGDYDAESQHLYLTLRVQGVMVCPCDITFEDVEIPFDSEAEETISFNRSEFDDVEIIPAEKDHVELLPIIFRQILLEVPIKVRKPGLIDYPKGDGWAVMDEATYEAEKANRIDPRLAALKNYKPQDE